NAFRFRENLKESRRKRAGYSHGPIRWIDHFAPATLLGSATFGNCHHPVINPAVSTESRSTAVGPDLLKCYLDGPGLCLAWAGQFPPRAQTLFVYALVLETLFPLVSDTNAMQTAGPVGSRTISSSFLTLNVSNRALGFDSSSRSPPPRERNRVSRTSAFPNRVWARGGGG